MMTFNSDIKVEDLIENSFYAALITVYELCPNKLQGTTIRSLVDKIQQIKSVYKLRENYETTPSLLYKKSCQIQFGHRHHNYKTLLTFIYCSPYLFVLIIFINLFGIPT